MGFDPNAIVKKVQYITIDSEFINSSNITVGSYSMGGNNNFSVTFGTTVSSQGGTGQYANSLTNFTYTSSNIFVQEMKNVIGLKLVDFYVTQIGSNEADGQGTKYIDILCPLMPDAAQILDERKSKVFARIPLERDFGGSASLVVNDKQWKSFNRQTNYFNPLSIKQLNFQMWEMVGGGTPSNPFQPDVYKPLQPDAAFYMILEVTTIDNDVVTLPKEDPTLKIVGAIESLETKLSTLFEKFPDIIKSSLPDSVPVPERVEEIEEVELPPKVPEPIQFPKPKTDKKIYWIIAIILIFIAYLIGSNKKPTV